MRASEKFCVALNLFQRICIDDVIVGLQRSHKGDRSVVHNRLDTLPNTSKPAPGHKIYPYLLRKLLITRPNQVWAMDITYIPMARGFIYLAAALDWFTRRVLAWRVSITLEADFCIEALEEALTKYGAPEILNSDSQKMIGHLEKLR